MDTPLIITHAAHDDGRMGAAHPQLLHAPCGKRRFARATNGQVANGERRQS